MGIHSGLERVGARRVRLGEGVTGSELFEPDGTMATFVVPWHVPGTLRVSLRGGAGGTGGAGRVVVLTGTI